MREDVIRAHAELPALCEHIHLPLQSGSSRILRAMRRTYNRERYLDRVALIREHVPDCALTTDIIVGFPGETDEDFERTLEVVEQVGYDGAFTFIYSPRRGTEAATLRRPGAARRQARADGAPGRGGAEPRARARPALRRPHDRGARRGPEPHRRRRALRGRSRHNKAVNFDGTAAPGELVEVEIEAATSTDALRPRAAPEPRRLSRRPWMRVLAIFGPTAVGKTGVAIEVAELLRERGEDPVAVSCDSIQVYRGLEVLSGAATPAERERLEHRLIGFAAVTRSSRPGGSRSSRTPRSTRCSRRAGARSSSAAPASTCGPRSPSSTCARRCPRRSAQRSRPISPSGGGGPARRALARARLGRASQRPQADRAPDRARATAGSRRHATGEACGRRARASRPRWSG